MHTYASNGAPGTILSGGGRYRKQERHGRQSWKSEIEIKDLFCFDVETMSILNNIYYFCEVTYLVIFKAF